MKIRTKIRTRLNVEDIFFAIALFCVSSFALLEHSNIALPICSLLKYPMLIVGGVSLLCALNTLLKSFRKKKYFYVLLMVAAFCVLLMLTAFANRSPKIGSNPMHHTLRLIIYIVELFALAIWAAETGRSKQVMEFLFRYVLVLAIITDFLLFTKLIVFYSGRHEVYIVGTKFSVSYLHMSLVTLWVIHKNMELHREIKTKRRVLFLMVFILAVSVKVNCMTGVVGCAALMVFFAMLNTKIQRQFIRFTHPLFLLLFFVGSVLFPFVAEKILSLPAVQYVIEELFGRDSTLTGRLSVFLEFFEKTRGQLMWGYGYGNGYAVSETLFGVANAQNALLQWTLQVGVPTTMVLCALMLVIFGQLSRSPRQRYLLPLAVLIIVYTILGTVETTFNMSFIMWFALVFMNVNARPLPSGHAAELN